MHTKMYTSKGQICTLVHATTKADEYIFAYAKTSAVKLRNKGPAPTSPGDTGEHLDCYQTETMAILAGDCTNDKPLICN